MRISGTNGRDTLNGTPGDDTISGLGSRDKIYGDAGDDLILGGEGNDFLSGGSGRDTIFGGRGDDRLIGEVMTGGLGSDRFQGRLATDIGDGDFGNIAIGQIALLGVGSTYVPRMNFHFNSTNTRFIETNGRPDFVFVSWATRPTAPIESVGRLEVSGAGTLDLRQTRLSATDDRFETRFGMDGHAEADVLNKLDFSNDAAVAGSQTVHLTSSHIAYNMVVEGNSSSREPNILHIYRPGDFSELVFRGWDQAGARGQDEVIIDLASPITTRQYNGPFSAAASRSATVGTSENDQILGSSGNDTVDGGPGYDTVTLGQGNDVFQIRDGWSAGRTRAETVKAGSGSDTFSGLVSSNGIIDLVNGTAAYPEGRVTLFSVENATGGDGADEILGTIGRNVLRGGAGRDTIRGGEGPDTIDGGRGRDLLEGGRGDDVFLLKTFDADTVNGGAGVDWIKGPDIFSTAVDLATGTSTSRTVPDLPRAILKSVENVSTGEMDDIVVASRAVNEIHTGEGADTIVGVGLDDSIFADQGNDTVFITGAPTWVDGGSGYDLIDFSAVPRVDIEIASDVQFPNLITSAFKGFEHVIGSPGDDRIKMEGIVQRMHGGNGDDTLIGSGSAFIVDAVEDRINDVSAEISGGRGDDVIVLDNWSDDPRNPVDVVKGGPGTDLVGIGFWAQYETFIDLEARTISVGLESRFVRVARLEGVEGVVGVDSNYVTSDGSGYRVFGSSINNYIEGAKGRDAISGAGGNDTILGGRGSDQLLGNEGNDSLNGGNGPDTVSGGPGNDTIVGSKGEDLQLGGAGDDVMISFGDRDLYQGGKGDDRLVSDIGRETMDGGAGFDTADHRGIFFDYTFDLRSGLTNVGGEAFLNVEAALMGRGDDSVTGTEGANHLDGGSGDDTLLGMGGNDTLIGGDGDDEIRPGAGRATLDGGAGEDVLILTGARADYAVRPGRGVDGIVTSAGSIEEGRLTLTDVETIRFSDQDVLVAELTATIAPGGPGDDSIDGTSRAETVVGNGGNDTLDGDGGNDTVLGGEGNDLLFGGTGADSVDGAAGNDTVVGGFGPDTLFGGDGADSFVANRSLPELADFEGDDVIYAGAGDDFVVDRDGANVINLGDGNDLVNATATRIDGGDGDDSIIVAYVNGAETVVLGGLGNDQITVSNDQVANPQKGTLNGGDGNDLLVGSNRVSGETLIGGEGDDTLQPSGGNDLVQGGPGNDLFQFGTGDDTIDGGAGDLDVINVFGRIDRFTITPTAGGFELTDNVLGSTDIARLTNAEIAQFIDARITLADLETV